jgi:hypothetical protein
MPEDFKQLDIVRDSSELADDRHGTLDRRRYHSIDESLVDNDWHSRNRDGAPSLCVLMGNLSGSDDFARLASFPLFLDLPDETLRRILLLTLTLLGRLVLGFSSGVCGETVDQSDDNRLDGDFRVELGDGGQEWREGTQVEFVREDLQFHISTVLKWAGWDSLE